MRGGRSRWWSSSGSPPSSSIRPGRRSRAAHYTFGPYLSPFYSPEMFGDPPHALVRPQAGLVAGADPVVGGASSSSGLPAASASPATTTAAPTTRRSGPIRPPARWASRASSYLGEHSFPLILQNVHRYFLYLALIFLIFLLHDVWKALWFTDPATAAKSFGIGVGTLVLATNVDAARLLHLRLPLVAPPGRRDISTGSPARRRARRPTTASSCLNRRHMMFAWLSLCSVGFSDLYVRLCSMGIWTDWRIF